MKRRWNVLNTAHTLRWLNLGPQRNKLRSFSPRSLPPCVPPPLPTPRHITGRRTVSITFLWKVTWTPRSRGMDSTVWVWKLGEGGLPVSLENFLFLSSPLLQLVTSYLSNVTFKVEFITSCLCPHCIKSKCPKTIENIMTPTRGWPQILWAVSCMLFLLCSLVH